MGAGYSNEFIGTVGAIGENQLNQISFTDALPVRRKPSGIGVGVGASAGAGTEIGNSCGEKQTVTSEMILAMCNRCRLGEITSEQLVFWLEEILKSPKIRINKLLRNIVKKYIPLLKSSMYDTSFRKSLSKFENAIRRNN